MHLIDAHFFGATGTTGTADWSPPATTLSQVYYQLIHVERPASSSYNAHTQVITVKKGAR